MRKALLIATLLIVLLAACGDGPKLLVPEPIGPVGPMGTNLTWSPDGSRIAFSYGLTSFTICILDEDGSNSRIVLPEGTRPTPIPDWSPDGGGIVFSANSRIYLARADASELNQLGFGEDPVWSPDGLRIANSLNGDIYVMDADGSNEVRLTEGRNADRPSWSPDGSRIAFRSLRSVTAEEIARQFNPPTPYTGNVDIYVIQSDGSDLRLLVDGFISDKSFLGLDWSPDGRMIAYQDTDQRDDEIWVVSSDGLNVASAPGFFGSSPKWSPDGSATVFQGTDGVSVLDPDSNEVKRLTKDRGDHGPAWSPDGSRIAFFRTDLLLMEADGTNQRRLAGVEESCGGT